MLLMLSALSCAAQNFTLKWDPSPEASVTNYVIYGSTNANFATNLSVAPLKISVGTNTSLLVEASKPGRYYFTATAVAGGIQSTNSNVLPVLVPEPPANLFTVAVLWGAEVGAVTNQALFLKLWPKP